MADSEYILKLVAQLEDQTKGVFDQIAQHGKVAGGDVKKSLASVKRAVDGLEKKLANLKKALATGTGNTQNVQEQIGWFEKLKNNATALQNELQKLPFGMGGLVTSAIGGVSAVLSLKYAFDKLHETINEGLMLYSKAALGQEQLATIWRNTGHNMPIAQLKGYMAELQKATTYGPGEIAQASRALAIHNPISDDLMPRALKAAADLAAFKNMDIGSAAMMLGRASEGQFFGLQRMGVAISATTKESKKFDDVLKDIERSLGGQAALAAGTYHGQLQKVEHEYQAIQKVIGAVAEPAAKVWTGAKLSRLEDLNEQAKKSLEAGGLKDLQKTLENIALAFSKQGGGGGDWLEKTLKTAYAYLLGMHPAMLIFIKLLDKIGEKKGESKEDKQSTSVQETRVEPTPAQAEAIELAEKMAKDHAEWKQIWEEMPPELIPKDTLDYLINAEGALENFSLILADIQKNLNNIDFGKLNPDIDWKEEGKKAQAYFDRIKGFAEVNFQAQKSLVWATAQSKEDAENKIAKLDNEYSLRKIQNAQTEHDAIIALKEQEFKKEEDRVKGSHRVDATDPDIRKNQQEDLDAALKKLNEERTTFSIEQEKKLSEAIQNEIKSRQDAYVKEQQKQIELQQKMRDAALETQKALTDVALAGANEWTKLTAKFREANDTLRRAIEELPKSPERAADLAKQAQSAFAALKQDVAALEKSLRDTTSHFDNLATQIRQSTMHPLEKRADEMAELDRMIVKARQLVEVGNLQEAEAIYKEAGSKAAGLATPVEGQSKYAAQDDAARYFGVIRAEAEALAKARVEQGKAVNQLVAGGIQQAGDVQQQALGEQLKTTNEHLADLTEAVKALTNSLNATKEIKPSGDAQRKSGANIPESGQAQGTGQASAGGEYRIPEGAQGADYQPMAASAGQGTGGGTGQGGGGGWQGTAAGGEVTPGGTPGQPSSGEDWNNPQVQEKWLRARVAESTAKYKSTALNAEENYAETLRYSGTPTFYNQQGKGHQGNAQYYDQSTGRMIEDRDGSIAAAQESAQQKRDQRAADEAQQEKREAYVDKMAKAGYGEGFEKMSNADIDAEMATEKIQSDYAHGTGTYDKRLGDVNAMQKATWGALDTNQPFYNAVNAAMQPPSKPSSDSAEDDAQSKGGDGTDTFKEQVVAFAKAVDVFSNQAQVPFKIEVTATGGASVANTDMFG